MRFAVNAAALAACTTPPGEQDAVTRLVTVGPPRVDCAGVVPQSCLVVDDELLHDTIEEGCHVEGSSFLLKADNRRIGAGPAGSNFSAAPGISRHEL